MENYLVFLRYYYIIVVIYCMFIDNFTRKKYNILCRGKFLGIFNGEEIFNRCWNVGFYVRILFFFGLYR